MALITGLPWFPAWADLDEGLIAHYPFDGDANDESVNGNDGTVHGATLIEDRFGSADSAYNFDGDGDKITAENIPALQLGTQAFMISTWIKTTQTGIWKRIITRRSATTNGFWYSLAMMNNKARFEIAAAVQLDSTRNINDGNWHFVAVTRDLSTSLFSMYVDGQLESQLADQGYNLTGTGNIPLEIGIWSTEAYGGTTFNGLIDDIRIYNRALSEDEIQSLYERKPNLVELANFTATPTQNGISLDWKTTSERDTAGFFIWRGTPLADGKCTNDHSNYKDIMQLSFDNARGDLSSGATYSRTDSNVTSGTSYCYLLEDVEFDGDSEFHWNFIDSATAK
jgi:hypothetical protein